MTETPEPRRDGIGASEDFQQALAAITTKAASAGLKPDSAYMSMAIYNERGTIGHDYQQAEWLRQQLARYTYKPGWTLELVSSPYNSIYSPYYVRISARVENTYNPGEMITIAGAYPLHIPPGRERDENAFAKQLGRAIQECEIHESREWLKRDGVIVDNPHEHL